MHKIQFLAATVYLLAVPVLAMRTDGQATAMDIVNAHLATYASLYEFNESQSEFWHELGPAKRWEEVIKRKHAFISKNVIQNIDVALSQIAERNRTNIRGFVIDKQIVASIIKGIIVACEKWDLAKTLASIGKTEVEQYLSSRNGNDIVKDLESLRAAVLSALANDPFKVQEREVVRTLHKMPKGSRKIASTLLLQMRRESGEKLIACQEHLTHLLTFPEQFKVLPPGFVVRNDQCGGSECGGCDGMLNNFITKIFQESDLKIYSKQTKRGLMNAVKSICKHSQLAAEYGDMEKINDKQVFLFYGDHGTGKSHAALEITKQLGLPVHEIHSLNKDDFSYSKLSGNSEYLESKLGVIFQAFFVKDADGKSWRNPVIIINDIDKMMGKYNNMLKPLQDTFCETIKKIYSAYFGTEIEISGIIWILTANTDFGQSAGNEPSPKKFSNGKDNFGPLRDRMEFIYFDRMKEDQLKIFLSDYITNHKLFEKSTCYEFSQCEEMKDKLIDFLVCKYPGCSLRRIEKHAKYLSELPENEWEAYADADCATAGPADESEDSDD